MHLVGYLYEENTHTLCHWDNIISGVAIDEEKFRVSVWS
jgi:hypothetical protein